MRTPPLLMILAWVLILRKPLGSHGVHAPVDCPPTISRAPTFSPSKSAVPTSSPAPSPSPSAVPTNTQSPSHSGVPSTSYPSDFPSISPSESPSSFPSTSPAPSPSPSAAPTEAPSILPTGAPTVSAAPSTIPSDLPSTIPSTIPSDEPSMTPTSAPSASFAPTSTAQPTGETYLFAQGVVLRLPQVQRIMDDDVIAYLEEEIKLHLQRHLSITPEGLMEGTFSVEAVTVTHQELQVTSNGRHPLRRHLQQQEQQELQLILQVVAVAVLERNSNFDLQVFLELYFDNENNLLALLESLGELHADVDFEGQADGSIEPTIIQRPISSKAPAVAGSVFGMAVLLVGAAMLSMMWQKRKRREDRDKDLPNLSTLDSEDTQPNIFVVDSQTFEAKSIIGRSLPSEIGPKSSGDYKWTKRLQQVSPGNQSIDSAATNENENSHSKQSVPWTVPEHLMYTPALIETESNIEVPDTPVTGFTGCGTAFISTQTPQGNSVGDGKHVADEKSEIFLRAETRNGTQLYGFNPSSKRASTMTALDSQRPPRNDKTDRTSEAKTTRRSFRFKGAFFSPFQKTHLPQDNLDNHKNDENGDNSDLDAASMTGVLLSTESEGIGASMTPLGRKEESFDSGMGSPPKEIGGPACLPDRVTSNISHKSDNGSIGIVNEVAFLCSANTIALGPDHSSTHFNTSRRSSTSMVAFALPGSTLADNADHDTGKATKTLSSRRSTSNYYFSDESDAENSVAERPL